MMSGNVTRVLTANERIDRSRWQQWPLEDISVLVLDWAGDVLEMSLTSLFGAASRAECRCCC